MQGDSLSLPNTGFRVIEVKPGLHGFYKWLKSQYRQNKTSVESGQNPQAATSFFHRLKHWIFSSAKRLQSRTGIFKASRMPDLTDLWVTPAYNAVKKEKRWDLVISTSGPYTVHAVAVKIKKSGLASRWIADYRDPWSDNRIFPGIFPLNRLESYLERKWLRHADKITTVSHPLKNAFADKYGSEKAAVIENGIDPYDFIGLDAAFVYPGIAKFRIVHTGTVYDKIYNPFPLLQSIQTLAKDPEYCGLLRHLEIVFVGHSGQELPLFIQDSELAQYVKIMPPMTRSEALRMQRDADALLFLAWGDLEKEGILSGKIFEYMYSTTPIISIGGTSSAHDLRINERISIGVNLGLNKDRIRRYLVESLAKFQRGEKPQKIPANRQLAIENFTRESQAQKLLSLVSVS